MATVSRRHAPPCHASTKVWLGVLKRSLACLLETVAILTFKKIFFTKTFLYLNGITILIISTSNALYFSYKSQYNTLICVEIKYNITHWFR